MGNLLRGRRDDRDGAEAGDRGEAGARAGAVARLLQPRLVTTLPLYRYRHLGHLGQAPHQHSSRTKVGGPIPCQ